MPQTQYIQLTIGGRVFDVPTSEDLPVSIDFQMEDEDNFEEKKGATALDIIVPATLDNSEAMNTFFNPQSEDYSPDNFLKDVQPCSLVAAGNELLVGKAILKRARKTNVPQDMEIDLYAQNADWAIENSELTLHDVVTDQTHIFDLSTASVPGVIDTSWNYDGSTEGEEFVYAPFRSREPFGETGDGEIPDMIFRPVNARPSMFIYWLLYRGFQRAGYKIVSNFMDSEYFRRMVMPWTFGNFMFVTEAQNAMMGFLATGPLAATRSLLGTYGGTPYSWQVKNGTAGATTNGYAYYDTNLLNHDEVFQLNNVLTSIGYIGNPLCYSYTDATGAMNYTYLNDWSFLGKITVGFEIKLTAWIQVTLASNANIDIEVYVNGTLYSTVSSMFSKSGSGSDIGTRSSYFEVADLNPGDVVSVKVYYHIFRSLTGAASVFIMASGDDMVFGPGSQSFGDIRSYLKLTYIRRQLGSVINFKDFERLKNLKWLDLLRGVVDAFNLQFQTDSIGKRVYIEPTHPYSIDNNPASLNAGYYTGALQDWTDKQDLKKITTVENYADYDRVFEIKMRGDMNDGGSKTLFDRYSANISKSVYQFPSRFKKGTKELENRFFSFVTHFEHLLWKDITGVAPQLICIVPENVSNTSNSESEYTFEPKLAYYKGKVDRAVYGGWNFNEDDSLDLPYMFAVNYKPGGEDDPILTYCDQKIDPAGTPVKGKGLFKRFFWQRFAIMRHGKRMISSMKLNNSDALDSLQREFKIIGEGKYQLVAINGYRPLINDSTECTFWLWWPVTQADYDNTYPSENSVMHETAEPNSPDYRYYPAMVSYADIPK